MINRFSTIRPVPPPAAQDNKERARHDVPATRDASLNAAQQRVYNEMFRAIEMLGRKLERAEQERERLVARLHDIETLAVRDEKTGRLMLAPPAATGRGAFLAGAMPKWAVGTAVVSLGVAFLSLSVAFLQPVPTRLTPQQIAALDNMVATRMTTLDTKPWTRFENPAATPAAAPETERASATDILAAQFGVDAEMAAEDVTGDVVADDVVAGDIAAAGMADDVAPLTPVADVAAAQAQQAEIIAHNVVPPISTRVDADAGLPVAMRDLEERAFDGDAAAQHDLATLYAAGSGGVTKDYKRAVYWFSRAADAGVANAHYNLGVLFQQGMGVRTDLGKAIGWYKSAAELGHPEAMYNLGIAYIEGIGVTRNIERGANYFRRAADAGVAQAAYNLGVLYESSFMGQIDIAAAMDWYARAEKLGHADSAQAVQRLARQQSIDAQGIEPAAGITQ